MVTHNPKLAETYSTRIVRLRDGQIASDSNPYDGDELPAAGILVAISVILTMIAGLIPSRMAAKKDPVIALRTE